VASRGNAILIASGLVVLFGLATLLGADRGRIDADPREVARSSLEDATSEGSGSIEAQQGLRWLRDDVARRPLAGQSRVAYATLVLGVSRSIDELEIAAFHARLAASLSPVTVPVVRGAALVLIQSGHPDECMALIRRMFDYAPAAAARLLDLTAPLLSEAQIDEAVDDTPQAWIAWARQLRLTGRAELADLWLDRAFRRWPDYLPLRIRATRKAVETGDLELLGRLVGREQTIPPVAEASSLFVHRAFLEARNGRMHRAEDDLRRALDLGAGIPTVLTQAGDVYLEMGRAEEARNLWQRALYRLDPRDLPGRKGTLRRLARLEESLGSPGKALAHWRTLQRLDPDDFEANGRLRALTEP
jgi:tetratricopeptide (TPR) repeat protein